MPKPNREILQKADMALNDLQSDGGYLQPAQAQRFMRILIDEARVMNMATVTPMRSHKQQIDKIRFNSRVMRAGQEATALPEADRAKPDLTQVELDAKLFKAEVRLNTEVLEDNIERQTLRQTIMQILGERIALDMDDIIVNGDTASGDSFLAQFDGILKQATSNIVDHGSAAISPSLFRDMLKSMPSEFLRQKRRMRFLTSVDAEIDYRDTIADRKTVLGDKLLEQEAPIAYSGIPIMDVPVFPEDQGASNDETSVVLTDPKNINVGIWRRMKIETDKLIREGVLLIVVTMRFDMKYTEETAVVKATKVKVGA